MSRAWMLTLLTGGSTVALKSIGAMIGARSGRSAVQQLISRATPLLLPGVLTALIVVQVFSSGRHLTVDARLWGLLIAITGVQLRWPPALVLVAAALATALVRQTGVV